jgi:hypothetical protein
VEIENALKGASMTEPKTHTLDVPGAVLHYDVRSNDSSTQPVLLLIGSPMGATGFGTLAGYFADRTVVTYDAQVDDVECVESEVVQVVVHGLAPRARRPVVPSHLMRRSATGLTVPAVISIDRAQAGPASLPACPFLSFVPAGSMTVFPTLTLRSLRLVAWYSPLARARSTRTG